MKTTLLAFLLFTTLLYGQCPIGDVTFNSQADVNNFVENYPNCDTISGHLFITGTVNNLSALDYLLNIEGDLIIRDTQLTTVSNFNSLIEVLNTIEISDNTMLTEVVGFNELIHLSMLFLIQNNPNLVTINGFNNATAVFGDFSLNANTSLQTVIGFSSLTTVGSFLGINDSPSLISIPSFNNLNFIGWSVQFFNTGLTDISGFDNLTSIGDIDPTSGFVIGSNQNLVSISGFNCLESIEFDLLIQDNPLLETISGLCSLESVGQFFTIRNNASLTSLNGLQSLTSVSRTGYETSVVLEIHDNPQLSDCDPLCNLLSSNGIIGLTNITDNLTGCDSEADIDTSSCIPFEVLDCTNLIDPLDGAVNVDIDTNISWNPVAGATSYLISIGTTPEGTQIANNLNVGNITTYDLPNDLPENTEIFVKVKPFNNVGQAKCCAEESFTTINTNTATLDCTHLLTPLNNAIDVDVSSNIIWDMVIGATGYLISVGTSSGATDIADTIDVGNVTNFSPAWHFDYLPESTTIFVTITPYNNSEQVSGCIEESFTTEELIPNCTTLSNPIDGSTNVLTTTIINWNSVTKATGYIISIGTIFGGTDLVDNLDVGNMTSYDPPVNLPENTTIFVSITPYNTFGNSTECLEESFFTQGAGIECPSLSNPSNGALNVPVSTNLSWNTSSMATGYILNIGLTPSGSEIINNLDIGNVTTFNLSENFPFGTQIYVKIIPYNTLGQMQTCQTESFTTVKDSLFVPRFFTPNNDEHNDNWIVKDPLNEIEVVYIYDRYGKLLKTLYNFQEGWNGLFNNQFMPVNDYWYVIKLKSGNQRTGHFTLKR